MRAGSFEINPISEVNSEKGRIKFLAHDLRCREPHFVRPHDVPSNKISDKSMGPPCSRPRSHGQGIGTWRRSRGVRVEAWKSRWLNSLFQRCTPFSTSSQNLPIIGPELSKSGFGAVSVKWLGGMMGRKSIVIALFNRKMILPIKGL